MSTSTENKRQRSRLKKLRESGLYSGKLPRGKLTAYQKGLIKKYEDVVRGRAKVLKPKNPKDYKKLYRVSGDKVIVPRGKGERVAINKRGYIERVRKGPRGENIKSVLKRTTAAKLPPPPPPKKRVRYALPFARKVGKGEYRLEWHRFPSYQKLKDFMQDYETLDDKGRARYGDWANFVFEESIDDNRPQAERNRALNEAAIKYGRAKAEHFAGTSTLAPIMRAGRKARRNKQRMRRRGRA